MKKVELILHPIRFRIMQVINGHALTTQEIADEMPEVPKSSIYRQLKMLLDGDMLTIAETRLVNGIQEKTYRLAQQPYLTAEDIAEVTAEQHVHYFTVYVMNVLREFADYVQGSETQAGGIDMLADQAGYTEAAVYADPAELAVLHTELNAAIMKVARNEPGNGRSKHKLAIITHPLKIKSDREQ